MIGPMLAYVFWHRPAAQVDGDAYEASLCAFHAGLRDDPPPGLKASACLRLDTPAPAWLADANWPNAAHPAPELSTAVVYEDWYLVDGWAALGELNAGAVQAPRLRSHDAAARLSTGGPGAIFALRSEGEPRLDAPAVTWSAQPVSGDTVWQRQLVLGPTPQWCVAGDVGEVTRSVVCAPSSSGGRRPLNRAPTADT